MSDDHHENGTSNGDVPEIELIIKVSKYSFSYLNIIPSTHEYTDRLKKKK